MAEIGIGVLWDSLIETMAQDTREYEAALQEIRQPSAKEQDLQALLLTTPWEDQAPILESLLEIERNRQEAIKLLTEQVKALQKTAEALRVMSYTARGTKGTRCIS